MPLRVGPLTREAFAPFGQVLMAVGDDAHRQEFAALLKNFRPQATLNMAFLLSKPSDPPSRIHTLERHPRSSQSFVPVQGTRYLVAVCPSAADGSPDLGDVTAFIAKGTQAVTIPMCGTCLIWCWADPGCSSCCAGTAETCKTPNTSPLAPPIRLYFAV